MFADIVREVALAPVSVRVRTPGIHGCEIVDRQGRVYRCSDAEIDESRALAAVQEGAQLIWDPCGCGGHCGLSWFTADDIRQSTRGARPLIGRTKRWRGNISEWSSDDGATLLLAEDAVEWGDLLG